MNNPRIFSLPNGIRVLHQPAPDTEIAHCCLVINTGSRDEDPDKAGLAHFIEHLLFKGTVRRSPYHILNRLEAVGADLNAYTTKEQTSVHASFLVKHAERALDLLTDITFHSTFPEAEIEKEKGVIIDEIESYRDTPDEFIQDQFDELLFKGHTLANNILGTPETVKSFSRNDLLHFMAQNYSADGIVFGFCGNISSAKLQKIAEKYLGTVALNKRLPVRTPLPDYKPEKQQQNRNFLQAHAVIGNRCYDQYDEKRIPMLLLNNMLGGPGMSSRLNLEIREKHGIAYHIESNYTPLQDTGFFTIYLATDSRRMNKSLSLVYKELQKLKEKELGRLQLHQAKQKFMGQIALAEENRLGVILAMAKNLLDYNRVDSLTDIFEKIGRVTAPQIREIANEVFDTDLLSTLVFYPEEL